MAYYRDLSQFDYFGAPQVKLIAVGWLSLNESHTRGDVTGEFFEALLRLLVDPWQPVAFAGSASCAFCRFTGGPAQIKHKGITVSLGSSNLFVPSDEGVYVAPSLIAHYIDAHEYSPPTEFRRAVNACPEMRSMLYLRALRHHGVHELR